MMARMEMDYKIDFWKLFRMNFFQIFKSVLEIFDILQKCCCNTKFLQQIAFYPSECFFLKLLFRKLREHSLHV